MATIDCQTKTEGRFRLTVEQFGRMDELGFFDDRRVELIQGIVYAMTSNPGHATSSELTGLVLRRIFANGWCVREAKPFAMGQRSLLEPDFAVVAGSIRDFATAHPTSAALVIEISEATLRKDRTVKAHLYARAGVPEYWIINLVDRQLEVHRGPGRVAARRGRFGYSEVTIVPESGTMAPLSAPMALVAVADLLP